MRRLESNGYVVTVTPFGRSCAWSMDVHGGPIAKAFKSIRSVRRIAPPDRAVTTRGDASHPLGLRRWFIEAAVSSGYVAKRSEAGSGRSKKTYSSTARPPIRCSWMMRSSTSGVHEWYQVPSG